MRDIKLTSLTYNSKSNKVWARFEIVVHQFKDIRSPLKLCRSLFAWEINTTANFHTLNMHGWFKCTCFFGLNRNWSWILCVQTLNPINHILFSEMNDPVELSKEIYSFYKYCGWKKSIIRSLNKFSLFFKRWRCGILFLEFCTVMYQGNSSICNLKF